MSLSKKNVAALLCAFVDAGENRKSEKTQAEYRRIVAAEIDGTPLGATIANEVTAPELDAVCRKIAKRSPTMAINVYKLIRAAFRWGFKKDLVDRDVSAKLDRPAEERRLPTEERTLNDEELRRLWLGVEALGREMATFIRLPLLCGTRRGETALSEWDEFDLREHGPSVWRVRAEHRKGQRGKKRGLVIPLPPLAVRLLVSLREETGLGARVFPVVGERFLANLFRSTEDARQVTGVRFTLHDLRATCATGVRRMSGLPHVPALVLGHQGVPGVPRRDVPLRPCRHRAGGRKGPERVGSVHRVARQARTAAARGVDPVDTESDAARVSHRHAASPRSRTRKDGATSAVQYSVRSAQ